MSDPDTSHGKKANGLGSGSFWAVIDNLAQQALSFVVFAILARLVSPEEFGLLTIAHLFILFSRMVVFDALALPVVRAPEPDRQMYSSLFWMCALASLLLAGAMFFSAGVLSALFRAPSLAPVLQGMSLSIVFFGLVRAYEARMVREMRFRQLAIRSIISVVIGGALGIVLAYRGWGAMALVVQQVSAAALAFALVVLQARWLPALLWRVRPVNYWREMRQVSLSGVLSFANSNGDSLVVGLFLGPYATGLYNLAKRLASAVYLVITASLLRVSLPMFSDTGGNRDALRRAYLQVLGLTLFLIVPMLLFQAVMAEPLLAGVFGQKWLPAATTLAALALLYILSSVTEMNNYVLFAVGRSHLPPLLGLLQLSLALSLAAVLSDYGLFAMSASFALAYVLVLPISQHVTNGAMGLSLRDLAISLLPPLSGALLMGAALWLVLSFTTFGNLLTVAFGLGAGCLAYLLPVAFFGRALRAHPAQVFDPLMAVQRFCAPNR